MNLHIEHALAAEYLVRASTRVLLSVKDLHIAAQDCWFAQHATKMPSRCTNGAWRIFPVTRLETMYLCT